jgi:hypothetical protein
LELLALNLLPSITLYCFAKWFCWLQNLFHLLNTSFWGLVLSFLKSAWVRWSGVRFEVSHLASLLRGFFG